MKHAAFIFAFALTGCGTTRVQVVKVPVAVSCVPATLAAEPHYPDTDAKLLAAADAAERYLLLAAGRRLRDARLGELEPIVQGCKTK